MGMKVVDGIRYREEDVERLAPVLSKALRPSARPVATKAGRGRRGTAASKAAKREPETVEAETAEAESVEAETGEAEK